MKWGILNKDFIKLLYNCKVISVSEIKTPMLIIWKGELTNDIYFYIAVIGCVLYISCGEREMILPYHLTITAHDSRIENLMGEQPTEIQKAVFSNSQMFFKIMSEITFKDVMKLLKWKYASKDVELFEVFLD